MSTEQREQWIAVEGHLCYHIIPATDRDKKFGWSSDPEHRRNLYVLEIARAFEDEFGRASAKANAELIVRAVNSHDDLLSALERLRGRFNALLSQKPVRDVAETLGEVDAALAKAKGETS